MLSLETILTRLQSIARVPTITSGEYRVEVDTELPLTDAANNFKSQIEILVSIWESRSSDLVLDLWLLIRSVVN